MSTVHAPHWLVSQPTCVPVRFSCSRRKCTRSVLGSTCALRSRPFTLIEAWIIDVPLRPHSLHTIHRTPNSQDPTSQTRMQSRIRIAWELEVGNRELEMEVTSCVSAISLIAVV